MEALAIALSAVGLLFVSNCLGWYLFAQSEKVSGELALENKALREGAEAHNEADEILAGPLASGGILRGRLLARAVRGLPESSPLGGASATSKADSTGGGGD